MGEIPIGTTKCTNYKNCKKKSQKFGAFDPRTLTMVALSDVADARATVMLMKREKSRGKNAMADSYSNHKPSS